MREIRNKPRVHVLVCINERDAVPGGLPCCAASDGQAIYEALYEWALAAGLAQQLFVTRTGCLANCHKDGVTIAIQPANVWFRAVTLADLTTLTEREILPRLSG